MIFLLLPHRDDQKNTEKYLRFRELPKKSLYRSCFIKHVSLQERAKKRVHHWRAIQVLFQNTKHFSTPYSGDIDLIF